MLLKHQKINQLKARIDESFQEWRIKGESKILRRFEWANARLTMGFCLEVFILIRKEEELLSAASASIQFFIVKHAELYCFEVLTAGQIQTNYLLYTHTHTHAEKRKRCTFIPMFFCVSDENKCSSLLFRFIVCNNRLNQFILNTKRPNLHRPHHSIRQSNNHQNWLEFGDKRMRKTHTEWERNKLTAATTKLNENNKVVFRINLWHKSKYCLVHFFRHIISCEYAFESICKWCVVYLFVLPLPLSRFEADFMLIWCYWGEKKITTSPSPSPTVTIKKWTMNGKNVRDNGDIRIWKDKQGVSRHWTWYDTHEHARARWLDILECAFFVRIVLFSVAFHSTLSSQNKQEL